MSEENELFQKPASLTQEKYPNNTQQTQWLTMAKQGHSDAFNEIVKEYQRPIYNLCYHMLNDRGDAEDAAQEVFIRAYTKLNSYDENRKFSTWLFAIASHYCLDRLKKRRLRLVFWDDLPHRHAIADQGAGQPEQLVIKQEIRGEIGQLLQMLKPEYRTALILRYWYDMQYQEIAEVMGTTISAIKSKLFRARKMVATQIAMPTPARSENLAPEIRRGAQPVYSYH